MEIGTEMQTYVSIYVPTDVSIHVLNVIDEWRRVARCSNVPLAVRVGNSTSRPLATRMEVTVFDVWAPIDNLSELLNSIRLLPSVVWNSLEITNIALLARRPWPGIETDRANEWKSRTHIKITTPYGVVDILRSRSDGDLSIHNVFSGKELIGQIQVNQYGFTAVQPDDSYCDCPTINSAASWLHWNSLPADQQRQIEFESEMVN